MGLIREFKEFATRGNVMDLAIGIIIGGAFGKIVSSLVADIIMPPIGFIVGGTNFSDIKLMLKDAVVDDGSGKIIKEAITLNFGNFIQAIFDFLIIAGAVFLLVKVMNKLYSKKKKEPPATLPILSKEVELLSEIRDILKRK